MTVTQLQIAKLKTDLFNERQYTLDLKSENASDYLKFLSTLKYTEELQIKASMTDRNRKIVNSELKAMRIQAKIIELENLQC